MIDTQGSAALPSFDSCYWTLSLPVAGDNFDG
jgi:hypothetical protein